MAIFTAAAIKAAAIAVGKALVKVAVAAVVGKVATKAISKLIAKRANTAAPSGGEGGGRIQLPPATDNKLPVLYGTAWLSGVVVDAKISTDQKFMWYVLAFCEGNSTLSFDTTDGVYLDGKKVTFSGTVGRVESLTTNTSGYSAQIDNKMAGKIFIYLYKNGYNTGFAPGTPDAQTVLSDSTTGGGIPVDLRWNSALYTDAGQSPTMNNTCFAIVRVEYNADAGTTSLPTLQCKITNNLGATFGARPGAAILDYMTNERYGCAISTDNIDTASLTTLDNYSNNSITYYDQSGTLQLQPYRYRINGPLDTSNSCLNNLQFLVDACDAWLQYNEATGKWRVVPNMPYSGLLSNLYSINDSALIGGIQINPIDLNDTYNQVEVAYPNTNVRDQTDYQIVDLTDPTTSWYSLYNSVLSPNEAINRLNITLPLVNNAVQAKYIAARRLLQSREDLVISCQLDYSGIQIDAGDVIRVTHDAYGWVDKLFRVSTVSEVQDENGSLSALIEAFEYNGTIYTDVVVTDYVPADNTGLIDPNVISPPCPPTITNFTDANALVTGFTVSTCVPEQGVIKYMDFNYGTTNVVANHQLYRTVQAAAGQAFTNSPDIANGNITTVSITVNDLPANTYYWSATARNDTAGRFSDGSNAYSWGGANIQPWNGNTNTGGIIGNQIQSNTIILRNFQSGMNIAQNISGNNFSISQGNPQGNLSPVLFPVDATANTTRNVPVYFTGVDPGANNIYPYAQGTANSTSGNNGNNYYQASSTGPYEPATAAILAAGDGEDDWYAICQDDFSAGSLSANQAYLINAGFTATTDTLGTVLQIVQGYKTGNNTFYGSDTNRLDTLTMLDVDTQYSWTRTQTIITGDQPNVTGGAVLVRCITAGATVIITSGSIQSLKGIPPFF